MGEINRNTFPPLFIFLSTRLDQKSHCEKPYIVAYAPYKVFLMYIAVFKCYSMQ
jgi:hypothetical protein